MITTVYAVVDNEGNIERVCETEPMAEEYMARNPTSWPRSIEAVDYEYRQE